MRDRSPARDAERSLIDAVSAARGHFRYESGHHGDLWLDLDPLLADARRVRSWAAALAAVADGCGAEAVCGPLTGGAFVAQFLAAELGVEFSFSERVVAADGSVRYRVPAPLRDRLSGKRVLIADDAVNAGSATLATLADVEACGATLAGFASLLALGDAATRIGGRYGVPFWTLASLERALWSAQNCPLCRSRMPLTDRPLSG